MLFSNFKIHFKIANWWLGFGLLLVILACLPHQAMPWKSWFNCSLFFLVFLQCVFIALREQRNKAIFINIAAYSLVSSLSFLNLVVGKGYLFGDDAMAFTVFQYRKALVTFLLVLAVTYIFVRFFFEKLSTRNCYLVSAAIVLPFWVYYFFPFLVDAEYLWHQSDNSPLYKAVLALTSLSFLMVWLYGVFLYKNERSLGEHINTLMVCFFFLILMDLIESVGLIYDIRLFEQSQYLLMGIHALFLFTLAYRLSHVYSTFGQFYDRIMVSGNDLGVPIKRRKNPYAVSFLNLVEGHWGRWKNPLAFLTLLILFGLNYFKVALFLQINLAALWFGVTVLFVYLSALYRKRTMNGDLLALKRVQGGLF